MVQKREHVQNGLTLIQNGLLAPIGCHSHWLSRSASGRPPARSSTQPSRSVQAAGLRPGTDIALALDVAASAFFNEDGTYSFEGAHKSSDEMIEIYDQWIDKYPLVSIEDPLNEEDWDGWVTFTAKVGDKIQVVGDDLFVTNPIRLAKGIEMKAANALLVKVNQIGSLTETLDAVELAHRNGFRCSMR